LNLLIFEFATAQGLQDPSLTLEGIAMLEGLLFDLKDTNADYLISRDFNGEPPENSCNPLQIHQDVGVWLDKNLENYQACLPVAPEENFTLYHLTRQIEDKGVKVMGSTSQSVLVCSDKFKTYNKLKNDFPLINTEKVHFNNLNEYKTDFNGGKKVVKPADGVSCSGVQVVASYPEFLKAALQIKKITKLPYFLLQDYIDGISTSVSLLSNGNSVTPLSLNLQNVQLEGPKIAYNGGRVPFEHKLSDEAKDISRRAVKSVKGLKGYVGVDLILDDEVHLVEINPRLTTPYVALRNIINLNLGEAIIHSVNGKLPRHVTLDGTMAFEKEENHLKIQKVI
jgi:tyramine---L-glutamate ligase